MNTPLHGEEPKSSAKLFAHSPSRTGSLVFIFLTIFIDLLGMTILIPTSVFIIQKYNSSALVVGLLSVVYAAAQFVSAPILGQLSDRYGRRPFLVVSMLGSAAGYFLFGLGGSLTVLFIARLIDGITAGNLSIAQAYIADISAPEERTKNFTIIGIAYGLGFILGPALGGILGQNNIALPAFIAGGLSMISALIGFIWLRESLAPEQQNHNRKQPFQMNPFHLIKGAGELSRLLGIIFWFNAAFTGLTTILSVFLIQQFGVHPSNLAGVLVLGGLTNLATQGFMGRKLLSQKQVARITGIGLVIQIGSYGGLALSNALIPVTIWYMLLCIGNGLVFPSLTALLSNGASKNDQGKISGLNASVTGITSVLAPLWAGWAYDQIAPIAPFVSFVVFVAAALGLLLRQSNKDWEQKMVDHSETADSK